MIRDNLLLLYSDAQMTFLQQVRELEAVEKMVGTTIIISENINYNADTLVYPISTVNT